MKVVGFCIINNYCVKQLTTFEHRVVSASDFKNYMIVNFDI